MTRQFYAPDQKAYQVKELFKGVDMTKPEVRELIAEVIACFVTNNDIDRLRIALADHHVLGEKLRLDVIKKRLRQSGVVPEWYKVHDDGFTTIDDFEKLKGNYKVTAAIDLSDLHVGPNGYKALNGFLSIQGLTISLKQPVMKLFSDLKIPVNSVRVLDPAHGNNALPREFEKLMRSWGSVLAKGPLTHRELLTMQTQLIDLPDDYDDFVTEL